MFFTILTNIFLDRLNVNFRFQFGENVIYLKNVYNRI